MMAIGVRLIQQALAYMHGKEARVFVQYCSLNFITV
jgi:hypothetical protein